MIIYHPLLKIISFPIWDYERKVHSRGRKFSTLSHVVIMKGLKLWKALIGVSHPFNLSIIIADKVLHYKSKQKQRKWKQKLDFPTTFPLSMGALFQIKFQNWNIHNMCWSCVCILCSGYSHFVHRERGIQTMVDACRTCLLLAPLNGFVYCILRGFSFQLSPMLMFVKLQVK